MIDTKDILAEWLSVHPDNKIPQCLEVLGEIIAEIKEYQASDAYDKHLESILREWKSVNTI